ncbi:MAG: VCBS repeat-containing protein, partial [Gemmatimonadetes bacterium]|nr:VCBS repeat-containing protein [Gemmatimonadota bacterium]
MPSSSRLRPRGRNVRALPVVPLALVLTGTAGTAAATGAVPAFVDRAAEAGIDVVNRCGAPPRFFIAESNGCGAAWLDYDGDGDLDLYVVNGNGLEALDGGKRVRYVADASNRLYRNDGDWRFADVTEAAGVGDRGFGNGVSVADVDNDGDPDL